jgi:uncharacterized protein DUF4389
VQLRIWKWQSNHNRAQTNTSDLEARAFHAPLFTIAFGMAQALLNLTAIVQFLWLLFASEPNRFLVRFGRSSSVWLADAAQFLSCASNEMPFPWKNWLDAG